MFLAELGMQQLFASQQFFSFATTTTRQRNNIVEPRGQEKFKKYLDLGV